MRKVLLASTLLLALSTTAFAGGHEHTTTQPATNNYTTNNYQHNSSAKANADAGAWSASRSSSQATGGQATSHATGGNATNGSASSGSANNSSNNGMTYNGGSSVAFSLPSFAGAGQCTPVGIGPGGFGSSGGGGGLFTWESTNCRNYYIALAYAAMGRQQEALELLAQITPEAEKALHPKQQQVSSNQAMPVAVTNTVKPAWCSRAKPTTEASQVYFNQQCH